MCRSFAAVSIKLENYTLELLSNPTSVFFYLYIIFKAKRDKEAKSFVPKLRHSKTLGLPLGATLGDSAKLRRGNGPSGTHRRKDPRLRHKTSTNQEISVSDFSLGWFSFLAVGSDLVSLFGMFFHFFVANFYLFPAGNTKNDWSKQTDFLIGTNPGQKVQ